MLQQDLTSRIIKAAYNVHSILGPGFSGKTYQKSLVVELHKMGIKAQRETLVPIYYRSLLVDEFQVDILVEDMIIVKLETSETLHLAHEELLGNYLTASKKNVGLLINFGNLVEVKRKYRVN